MLPNSVRESVHLDSGILSEGVMTISSDATDAAFILQTMTDLYSNKRLAPIREISTNAWDSHLAAAQTLIDGVDSACRTFARLVAPEIIQQVRLDAAVAAQAYLDRPIEVTLPKVGDPNPQFVVRDYGIGLNAHDILNIYIVFGKSTKRTDVSATGMLGLGCKSPLTYCLSFTVVGIKDGVKTVAVITKGDNGVGVGKILSETPSDEPNGVTVTIPVPPHDIGNFITDARTFFSYWRDPEVLVDGEPPEQVESALDIDDDIIVISNRGQSYVVQGNVPYRYDTKDNLPATVTWVPMGSVDFVPSREALHHTDHTDETLATIREYVKDRLDLIIDYELAIAETTWDRYRTMIRLSKAVPYGYRDKRLIVGWENSYIHERSKRHSAKSGWFVQHGTAERTDQINARWLELDREYLTYITGFPFKSVSRLHKDKVEAVGIDRYLLVPDDATIRLDGFPTRRWDSIPDLPKEERIKRAPEPKQPTLYDFYIAGSRTCWETYDGDLPIIYVFGSRDACDRMCRMLSNTFDVAAASILEAQENRFQRLHPDALPWKEWVQPVVREMERKLTKVDHRYLNAPEWQRSFARYFAHHRKDIKDREIRSLLNLGKSERVETILDVVRQMPVNLKPLFKDATLYDHLHGLHHGTGSTTIHSEYIRLHYPLLMNGDTYSSPGYRNASPDEWLIYLNAKHRAVKKAVETSDDSNSDDTAEAA